MAKQKPAKAKKTAAGRKTAAKSPKKAAPRAKPTPATDTGSSLGRPKVTGDELLYLLFKEDFHARNIFEFLQVRTVKELEEFSAGEILRRTTNPIKATLERIRCALAERNRCLVGDEEFAREYKSRADAK